MITVSNLSSYFVVFIVCCIDSASRLYYIVVCFALNDSFDFHFWFVCFFCIGFIIFGWLFRFFFVVIIFTIFSFFFFFRFSRLIVLLSILNIIWFDFCLYSIFQQRQKAYWLNYELRMLWCVRYRLSGGCGDDKTYTRLSKYFFPTFLQLE